MTNTLFESFTIRDLPRKHIHRLVFGAALTVAGIGVTLPAILRNAWLWWVAIPLIITGVILVYRSWVALVWRGKELLYTPDVDTTLFRGIMERNRAETAKWYAFKLTHEMDSFEASKLQEAIETEYPGAFVRAYPSVMPSWRKYGGEPAVIVLFLECPLQALLILEASRESLGLSWNPISSGTIGLGSSNIL